MLSTIGLSTIGPTNKLVSRLQKSVRALVCRLRCFPEGMTFRITLITLCGSAVRQWERHYGLHGHPFFACRRPYRPHRLGAPIGLPIGLKGASHSTCGPSLSNILEPPLRGSAVFLVVLLRGIADDPNHHQTLNDRSIDVPTGLTIARISLSAE